MDKPESNRGFKVMSFCYKFRDLFLPRMNILKEAEIQRGFHVLDYGCGPGGYVIPLAELVGTSGKIYALDIHPLAIEMVQADIHCMPNQAHGLLIGDHSEHTGESHRAYRYDRHHQLRAPKSAAWNGILRLCSF